MEKAIITILCFVTYFLWVIPLNAEEVNTDLEKRNKYEIIFGYGYSSWMGDLSMIGWEGSTKLTGGISLIKKETLKIEIEYGNWQSNYYGNFSTLDTYETKGTMYFQSLTSSLKYILFIKNDIGLYVGPGFGLYRRAYSLTFIKNSIVQNIKNGVNEWHLGLNIKIGIQLKLMKNTLVNIGSNVFSVNFENVGPISANSTNFTVLYQFKY